MYTYYCVNFETENAIKMLLTVADDDKQRILLSALMVISYRSIGLMRLYCHTSQDDWLDIIAWEYCHRGQLPVLCINYLVCICPWKGRAAPKEVNIPNTAMNSCSQSDLDMDNTAVFVSLRGGPDLSGSRGPPTKPFIFYFSLRDYDLVVVHCSSLV